MVSKLFFLRITISFLTLACCINQARGQGFYFYNDKYYESQLVLELGFSGGIMNGMTDIGGNKDRGQTIIGDITLKHTKFSGGMYVAGTFKDYIAARLDLNFGKVEAHDSSLKGATHPSAEGRYLRNLNFRSKITEAAFIIELHPRFFTDYVDRDPPRWSPYAFGGLGWVWYNPQAHFQGRWIDLAPLRLEGQDFTEYPDRKRYQKSARVVPIGIGIRYEASMLFTLRAEIGRHFLNSDYLDDVSQGDWIDPNLFYKYLRPQQANLAYQLYNRSTEINPPRNTRPRGDPDDNDAFWNFVIKVGISLNRQKRDLVRTPFH